MIEWLQLFFQGVKQFWNNSCVISLKTYAKKAVVKSLTSFSFHFFLT